MDNMDRLLRFGLLVFLLSLFFGAWCGNDRDKIAIIIDKYKSVGIDELLLRGDDFSNRGLKDSALIFYSMAYNNDRILVSDTASRQVLCKAMNRASLIYFYVCDYKTSLDLLLKALDICEEIGFYSYIGRIYNNIGNVYYQFSEYKTAKKYYKLAYMQRGDDYLLAAALNNLGIISSSEGDIDSALLLYKQSYRIRIESNDPLIGVSLNNIGGIYADAKSYDSSIYYCRLALKNARNMQSKQEEAKFLSNIASSYFEKRVFDSAVYYLKISNLIAEGNHYFDVLANNYLVLSKIEEELGNTKLSLSYYKKYSIMNDSIFNASKYANINELEFMYGMSKIDKQIMDLNAEQRLKERTIEMQRNFQIVLIFVLVVVLLFLILLYSKNRTLNFAYSALVAKNVEIVNSDKINQSLREEYKERLKEKEFEIKKLRKELSEHSEISKDVVEPVKYKSSSLSNDYKNELASLVLGVMTDSSVFCDPDFSLNRLADLVGSNYSYLSQIINDIFKTNFRSFINEYRIKEARKMLSDPTCQKYSIESISMMVGFKSKSSFNTAFKEITGVTPSFYIRSLKES